MTISCIRVSSDNLIGKNEDKSFDFLSKNLHNCGVTLKDWSVILNLRKDIYNAITSRDSDCIIVIGDGSINTHFDIKNVVCDYLNTSLTRDDNMVKFLSRYSKEHSLPDNIKDEYFLPIGASVLVNPFTFMQGWIIEDSKTIIYIPEGDRVLEYMYNNSIIPYLMRHQNQLLEHKSILMFGISEDDISDILRDNIPAPIMTTCYEENMLLKIVLTYPCDIDKNILNNCISDIYQKLRKFIITDDDTTIYQLALDLLTLSNKTLCIYETVTAGNVAQNLSKCKSVAKHLIEVCRVGFTQNNTIKELDIPQSMLTKHGFYSVNMAYEIAGALLDKTNCDLVLLTLGNLDEDNTCFVAVGDNDGIHIYKNTVNQRDKAIDTLSNSAIYYLIKKLKQNDLYFNKIIV